MEKIDEEIDVLTSVFEPFEGSLDKHIKDYHKKVKDFYKKAKAAPEKKQPSK